MANSNITKNALADSLKKLGSKKILDKITVSDITNDCGVNRQTFYYHFNDKYELLSWIYTQELFLPLTKDLTLDNWGEKLVELFTYMKKKKAFFMNTIKSSNNFFAEYLDKVLTELFKKVIKELDFYNHIDEKEKDIYARFFAYGMTGVIVDWTLKGMKEDEAELSKILQSMVIKSERMGYEIYLHKRGDKKST